MMGKITKDQQRDIDNKFNFIQAHTYTHDAVIMVSSRKGRFRLSDDIGIIFSRIGIKLKVKELLALSDDGVDMICETVKNDYKAGRHGVYAVSYTHLTLPTILLV